MSDTIETALAAGGGFGGVFFALRWLVGWITGRLDKRQAQLDTEHAALDMSWKDYRLLLERRQQDLSDRVHTVERQNRALRMSFEHVAGALIRVDPQNPALALAEQWMVAAFPTDFTLATHRAEAALNDDIAGGKHAA